MTTSHLLTIALRIVVSTGFYFIFRDMLSLKRRVDLLYEGKLAPQSPVVVDESSQTDAEDDDEDAAEYHVVDPPQPVPQAPDPIVVVMETTVDQAPAQETEEFRQVIIEDVTEPVEDTGKGRKRNVGKSK